MRKITVSALLLLLFLPACGLFDRPAVKPPAKPAKAQYSAEEYVKSLAIANLDIDAGTVPQIDVIKAYHAQRGKTQKRTVALIDYTEASERGRKHTLAVIPDSAGDNNYPLLQKIMERLKPENIQEIKLATVSVARDKTAKFTRDASKNNEEIQHQQRRLMSTAQPLAFVDEVQMKLQLIDFFIQSRWREPAYLLVDNVKQMLANATQRKTINADILQNLSQRLETAESTLHKELPFTL